MSAAWFFFFLGVVVFAPVSALIDRWSEGQFGNVWLYVGRGVMFAAIATFINYLARRLRLKAEAQAPGGDSDSASDTGH